MNANKNQLIKVDHCPPGFSSNIGSQSEWNNAYRKWLGKRGFHDELRMMEMASKRSQVSFKRRKTKYVEQENGGDEPNNLQD